MNLNEASAVNELLRFLLDAAGDPDGDPDAARRAAAMLADQAHQRLGDGVDGQLVDEWWPWRSCPRCGQPPVWCSCPLYDDVVSPLLVDPAGPPTPEQYRYGQRDYQLAAGTRRRRG